MAASQDNRKVLAKTIRSIFTTKYTKENISNVGRLLHIQKLSVSSLMILSTVLSHIEDIDIACASIDKDKRSHPFNPDLCSYGSNYWT